MTIIRIPAPEADVIDRLAVVQPDEAAWADGVDEAVTALVTAYAEASDVTNRFDVRLAPREVRIATARWLAERDGVEIAVEDDGDAGAVAEAVARELGLTDRQRRMLAVGAALRHDHINAPTKQLMRWAFSGWTGYLHQQQEAIAALLLAERGDYFAARDLVAEVARLGPVSVGYGMTGLLEVVLWSAVIAANT